jgi:hypothetical protein
MKYPTLAEVKAVRLENGPHRLVTCSVAGIEAFEENDEERFCNFLVEKLLRREPTIKTVLITFENSDELRLDIVITADCEAAECR